MRIYLYGCSGHAKVIFDILRCCNREVAAFFDDAPPENSSHLHDVPIFNTSQLSNIDPLQSRWIVAIGNNSDRKNIVQNLASKGYTFTTAVHPSAQIAKEVKIGAGTVVMANTVINIDSVIGQHAIINTGAIIDHDCQISDYVHIAPSCSLCGNVCIKEGSLLGVGTKIIPSVEVGRWTICGAGSVVVKSMPSHCVAYGVPATPRK
ncbi:acetyltransferase [Leptothoe spongobia]|uniref:Acetyltransferase n=1 Tax=Leptothoe spongobia TAU-MAC 1115 TaxID=1967444 RepID=A0A947GIE3_9CYAN|nr:acetyltransferase [Leptothoe spongobia]MBT9315654.1 acetyltransferase [Leptothoe spongobia TAU-MAC 1115]